MSTRVHDAREARQIERGRWRLDPARARVEFHARHVWGLMTVSGHFDRFEGVLDLADEPAIELTIEAQSLDTGNRRRDEHLRSAAFFHATDHPYVLFVSEHATLAGARLKVNGRLGAAGRAVPLEAVATLRDHDGGVEVDAVATVDQRGLGMTWSPLGMIRSPVRLTVKGLLVPDDAQG